MFESFIKQTFSAKDIPGTHQVQNDNFLISPSGHDSKALTKTKWRFNVYPGADLQMTIILGVLKMTIRQCPRPSCGQHVPDATGTKTFLTCQACGLYFRFNSDIKQLGLQAEDDKLQITHQQEDSSNFGQRYVPQDTVDFQCQDKIPKEVTSSSKAFSSNDEIKPKGSEAQNLTSDNLSALEVLSSKTNIDAKFQFASSAAPQLPSIDWNSGASGMVAWLNTSAAPAHEGDALGLRPDTFQAEAKRLQQERKDIECLVRVHFVSTVPESQPLRDVVKEYQAMPLDAQVYVRKIVDRFPTLPPYLAKRFANANAHRFSRLRKQNENNTGEAASSTSLKSRSEKNEEQSAIVRLPTDHNRKGASADSSRYRERLSESHANPKHSGHQTAKPMTKTMDLADSRPKPSSNASNLPKEYSKTARRSPQQLQFKCPHCNSLPSGYQTEEELQRHITQAHNEKKNKKKTKKKKRKTHFCIDVSGNQESFEKCANCQDGKIYTAFYNAITHLRKKHFHSATVTDSSVAGGPQFHHIDAPIYVLRPFVKEVKAATTSNDL